MGGGTSSVNMVNSSVHEQSSQSLNAVSRTTMERRTRRPRIFVKGEDDTSEFDINSLLSGDHIDEPTRKNLIDALGGFYFLAGGTKDPKMDLLLRAMQREEFEEGFLLINEGEPGSKLYIVDSGVLEVTINGEKVREMSKGSMLGELALLYDAPRSATVRCKTKCMLWSLKRESFKQIQAVSASSVRMQRARWLMNSTDLSVLSAIDLSRLVCTLHDVVYPPGKNLYKQKSLTSRILLIERGLAKIYTSEDLSAFSRDEIDKKFGIVRPPSAATVPPSTPVTVTEPQTWTSAGYLAGYVGEGCIIGVEALRSRAGLPDTWKWRRDGSKEGAVTPFSIVSIGEVKGTSFSVEVFENLFGSVLFGLQIGDLKSPDGKPLKKKKSRTQTKEIVFDSSKFKLKYVLGSGSFGVVTFAEYTNEATQDVTSYALKSLSKAAVVETGQLRHVMDERKLLGTMNSRFVVRLFGTYQTPHQLVMVTEPLDCGDLWSVIYETSPYKENDGLTVSLTAFYAASLVLALSHIHKNGIIFRDLKPENIMLDSTGYLRVIDFGFAKKVPYTTVDQNTGEVKVHCKTFTLCGTPEYLSPELIFNLGHDQSSDLWALGVLVYEMAMASTPFASKRPDNVTELFTNIAMVTKNGLHITSRLDCKTESPEIRSIITQLLRPEPSQRIGVQEGSTRKILEHPFFNYIDSKKLKSGTLVPEFIPTPLKNHSLISTLKSVKTFSGDQKQFEGF